MLQYFDTLTDDSGNSLLGATVTVTNYPAGTLAAIYSTNGTTSPVAASTVVADITGQISFYVPDGVYTLTYVYKGTTYKIRSPLQLLDPTSFVALLDTGAANAYVVTDPRLSAQLYSGMKVEFKALNANTSGSTLTVNGTPVALVQPGAFALAPGMIQAGGLVRVEYDGTNFQLIGSQGQPFYGRTQNEINAGVNPVNGVWEEGNFFRYMSSAKSADVMARTLTLDVTAECQVALSLLGFGVPIYSPAGWYLISSASLAVTSKAGFLWTAPHRLAVFVNKASAGKPTLKVTDCVYYEINGPAFVGRAGFPNQGILQSATAPGQNAFCGFKNILLQPNGIGIELTKINTITLECIEYWPSGTPIGLPNTGATTDSGTRKHAVFSDQTVVGSYCNAITIRDSNLTGVDTGIAGYAEVKIGADTIGNCQEVHIIDTELEGIETAVLFKNIFNWSLVRCYLDHATVTIDTCRYGQLDNCYNARTVSFVASINCFYNNSVQGDAASSFTIDAACGGCGAENTEFANAPTNNSTSSRFTNWSIAGVRQNDLGYARYSTPAFAAGDYTSDASWTVGAADVNTMRGLKQDKTFNLNFGLTSTTTAGSPTQLRMKIPGGYTSAAFQQFFTFFYSMDNGATQAIGCAFIPASSTFIRLQRDLAGTAFTNVTDLCYVAGSAAFEVA